MGSVGNMVGSVGTWWGQWEHDGVSGNMMGSVGT